MPVGFSLPTILVACALLAHSLGYTRASLTVVFASLAVAQNSVKCSVEQSVFCSSFVLSSHTSPHKGRKEVSSHFRVPFSHGQVREVQKICRGSLCRGSWVRGRGFECLPHG